MTGVRDLHVWTITSGLDSMSGHLVVDGGTDAKTVLTTAREAMTGKFGLSHTTIEIEDAASAAAEGTRAI